MFKTSFEFGSFGIQVCFGFRYSKFVFGWLKGQILYRAQPATKEGHPTTGIFACPLSSAFCFLTPEPLNPEPCQPRRSFLTAIALAKAVSEGGCTLIRFIESL
jgi:hypothetical protein